MPDKHALLVAINQYPELGEKYFLQGCNNDIDLYVDALQAKFGFTPDDMTVLRDDQATCDGILAGMESLVEKTNDGDIVVMVYSGHGSQRTDLEGDEPDGLDETIVPYDSGRDPKENRDITDDMIHDWLVRLCAKTDNVTLIFDCCHSATMTRDTFGLTARSVETDERDSFVLPAGYAERLTPAELPEGARATSPDSETTRSSGEAPSPGPSGWLPLGDRYVLFAGCRDEEFSYEYRRKCETTGERKKYGQMTFHLIQEIEKAVPGTTVRDIVDSIKSKVSAATSSRQHPQAEGRLDRELFGTRDIAPMRYVRVMGRAADTVTLSAGQAQAMTEGSQWGIYREGTKRANEEARLGCVEITTVQAVTSEARVVEEIESGVIAENARAVEEVHVYEDTPLAVVVRSSKEHADDARDFENLIEASPLLELVVDADDADFCAYLIAPRSAAGDPVPQIGAVETATWAVVGTDGRLAMPLHTKDEGDVPDVLLENLEKQNRYRRALELENANPGHPLKGKLDFVLKRRGADGSWVDAVPEPQGGDVVFAEGDELGIEVTNHHDAPLYVHILDFGLTQRISPLYPIEGSAEPVSPGKTLQIGLRPGDEMELGMPENFPYVRDPGEDAPTRGTETLKLFATTHEADFSLLRQEGMRSTDEGSTSALEGLLNMALTGQATRDIKRKKVEAGEEWTTVVRSFVLTAQSRL